MPDTSPAPPDYVPPDPPAPLAAGAEPVPGYVLVRPLGKGGYGEVWRATAPGGFPVAMKFVTLSGEAGAAELRSLDVLRELRHPHVLPVFGAWPSAWRLAVAMELADGTLLDRLKEAQSAGQAGIPGPELLAHLREAAAGLDYLHARKLQHRDVKPQNLLLVGGAVKVADFGMVRALKESSTKHTSGLSMAYAPPEFFRERVSRHSDQYSLAVAYCELRGGRLPFSGNQAAVMFGHLEGEPDLSMLPEAERPAVARALAKEAGARWPSCGEFVEAIGLAMADPSSASEPPQPVAHRTEAKPKPLPSPRRRGPAVALLGLAVVAVGAGVALWPKGGSPAATGGESPAVASAKSDPIPVPPESKSIPTTPVPTEKSPQQAGPPKADVGSKPNLPADDGKTFVSRTTGMKFVRIPAGTFRMGSPDSDADAQGEEKPQHDVTITKDFEMGVHEVTRGQFRKFVEDAGYKTEAETDGRGGFGTDADGKYEQKPAYTWRDTGAPQTDEHPVVNVTWADAARFAEWLAKKDGHAYRLPTEAEWEYACRAGSRSKYHFGDDPKDLPRYANVSDGAARKQLADQVAPGGRPFAAPVGRFQPNGFGLYDMHGNVWEWCADWHGDYPLGRVTDPTGPPQGTYRIVRGGGWDTSAWGCRSASRTWYEPSTRLTNLGFRLVRVPPK